MADDTISKVTVYKLKIDGFARLNLSGYKLVSSDIISTGAKSYPFQLYFLKQDEPKEASWYRLFTSVSLDIIDEKIIPKVLFAGFILIINISDSFYGLCGGLGHIILTKQPIEHRFGILLTQKILSISELKGLVQKDTGGEVNYLNRVFRGRYNPQGDLNNLRRILTHIRGKLKPENKFCEIIGKSISAGDALSVTGRKSLKEIVDFLCQVDELWHLPGSGLNIPQLEYIDKKFEKELLISLEKELIHLLVNYSSAPTDALFLDNLNIGYLPDRTERYALIYNRRRYEVATYDEVFYSASQILCELPEYERNLAFHKMSVRTFFDNGQFETFALYKLICGDITYRNEVYFLNNGLWYRASEDYVRSLELEINNVPFINSTELTLNRWDINSGITDEGAYNISHNNLCVFHEKMIFIEGEKGGIEFCDLMKVSEEGFTSLIHVKKASGAELRALFAQGYISAKLYSDSHEFREKVHNGDFGGRKNPPITVQTKQLLNSLSSNLKRNFTIVFAIFDDTPSHFIPNNPKTTSDYLKGTLTTFAKVDLLCRVVDLRAMGYNVAITRIKPYPSVS